MTNLQRTTNLLGGGTYNENAQRKLAGPFAELGVWPAVLTNGGFNFNRADRSKLSRLVVPGVVNVSPSDEALRAVGGFGGDDGRADTLRHIWEREVFHSVDRVVQTLQRHRVVGSQTIWHQGMRSGHHLVTEAALRRLHERVPDMLIFIRTVVPDDVIERQKALRGHALFHDLQREGIAQVTLVSDNSGPFAVRYKLDEQDKMEATAVASFAAGNAMFTRVKSLAEMGRGLGQLGPFAGLAFASRQVEAITTWMAPWRRDSDQYVRTQHGRVDLHHVLHEALLATKTVLHDRDARAIDVPIDLTVPCYLAYTMPISPTNKPAWEFLASELRRYLKQTYPSVVPMFASGQGTPDARYHGTWWIQASACFPLPSLLALLDDEPVLPARMADSAQARPLPSLVLPGRNGRGASTPEYVP